MKELKIFSYKKNHLKNNKNFTAKNTLHSKQKEKESTLKNTFLKRHSWKRNDKTRTNILLCLTLILGFLTKKVNEVE